MLNSKYIPYFFILSVFIITLVISSCSHPEETTAKQLTQAELIKRGAYLVEFGGCNDCHSTKIMTETGPLPDPAQLLSGHPVDEPLAEYKKEDVVKGKWVLFNQSSTVAIGPWGISYAANLTPDLETGIGGWNEEVFKNALRTGKHMGAGRPILPPMPWQGISQLTDEDIKSIYSYLQSIKPVKNKVPDPVLF